MNPEVALIQNRLSDQFGIGPVDETLCGTSSLDDRALAERYSASAGNFRLLTTAEIAVLSESEATTTNQERS